MQCSRIYYIKLKQTMDYYIFSYAIDIGQVIRSFGCKDLSLFESIQKDPLFKNYDLQNADLYVSLDEALRQIIYNEPYRKQSSKVYWYAFIALCGFLSKKLPYDNDYTLGWQTDLFDDLIRTEFNIEFSISEILSNNGVCFDLPESNGIPMFGCITGTRLKFIGDIMKQMFVDAVAIDKLFENDNKYDDQKAIVFESIEGFKANIDFCHQNQYSLISFCH